MLPIMQPHPLPFGVHPAWAQEYQRRWERARPLLVTAFVGMQALLVVLGLAAMIVAASGPTGAAIMLTSLPLVVVPAAYLAWFFLGGGYIRQTGPWGWRSGVAGLFQLGGVFLPAGVAGLPLAIIMPILAVAAVVVAVVTAQRAWRQLFGTHGAGPAPAATDLPIQYDTRVHQPRLFGRVTVDLRQVRWVLRPGGHSFPRITFVDDAVPLNRITGVWANRLSASDTTNGPFIAPRIPVPPGPVVVIRTPEREVLLAIDRADEFAALLDLRRELVTQAGWRG